MILNLYWNFWGYLVDHDSHRDYIGYILTGLQIAQMIIGASILFYITQKVYKNMDEKHRLESERTYKEATYFQRTIFLFIFFEILEVSLEISSFYNDNKEDTNEGEQGLKHMCNGTVNITIILSNFVNLF
jgi:hypothetical protein